MRRLRNLKTFFCLVMGSTISLSLARAESTGASGLNQPASSFTAFSKKCFQDLEVLSENTPAEFKQEMASLVEELASQKYILRKGEDQILRPLFVSLQGDFEKLLGSYLRDHHISSLIGVIHTPLPATPLCTEGEISEGLIHPSIQDSKRLYATMKRPEILREYLRSGATLIAAYAKDGLFKRSQIQQNIYRALLEKFPEKLIDRELKITEFPQDQIGALYLFKTNDGDLGVFAIKAFQANDPKDNSEWGFWFGSVHDPMIASYIKGLFGFFKEQGDFDIANFVDSSCFITEE